MNVDGAVPTSPPAAPLPISFVLLGSPLFVCLFVCLFPGSYSSTPVLLGATQAPIRRVHINSKKCLLQLTAKCGRPLSLAAGNGCTNKERCVPKPALCSAGDLDRHRLAEPELAELAPPGLFRAEGLKTRIEHRIARPSQSQHSHSTVTEGESGVASDYTPQPEHSISTGTTGRACHTARIGTIDIIGANIFL